MNRAASVVLIVLAVWPATFAAGEDSRDWCSCNSTTERIALLPRSAVSLKGEESFEWRPDFGERRWIYIVIHHSGTKAGSVEAIHKAHRQRKDAAGNPWLGIGYHFVIGNGAGMNDGEVQPTFRWEQQIHGAHSGSAVHNANGIGVCLIGNFQTNQPSKKQLQAVTDLISQLAQRYNIPARLIIGHHRVKPTACPGKHFPLQDVIRKALTTDQNID